jgi:hypothetical protein
MTGSSRDPELGFGFRRLGCGRIVKSGRWGWIRLTFFPRGADLGGHARGRRKRTLARRTLR